MRCRSGFTLAEVLAAIAILAVLAAAVVPFGRQLAAGEAALGQRAAARQALRSLVASGVRGRVVDDELVGQTGWHRRLRPLERTSPAGPGTLRWWWLAQIVDGGAEGRVLAEAVVTGPPP